MGCMQVIRIETAKRQEIIDITPPLREYLQRNSLRDGLLAVYSPHTTAGITVNENADPSVKRDINYFLNKLVPPEYGFTHSEGNSDAHIKGGLTGFSQTFIVEDGRIMLGTWQGIFFMEFDGPRQREVWVKFVPSPG